MSRKEIFSPNYTLFKGDISALPRSPSSYLLQPESTNITWNKNISLNLAQLIQFNAVKKLHYYHSSHLPFKLNEPLLPLLIYFFMDAKTRRKWIVEYLNTIGFCMSYHRVLETKYTLTRQLCKVFDKENSFRPRFNAVLYNTIIPWHKYSSIQKTLNDKQFKFKQETSNSSRILHPGNCTNISLSKDRKSKPTVCEITSK